LIGFHWYEKKGTLLLVQDDFNRTLQNSVLDTHKDAILEYYFILNRSFFFYIRSQEWIESTQAMISTVFGNSLLLGVTCLCWIVFLFIVIKMVADVYWKSKGCYKEIKPWSSPVSFIECIIDKIRADRLKNNKKKGKLTFHSSDSITASEWKNKKKGESSKRVSIVIFICLGDMNEYFLFSLEYVKVASLNWLGTAKDWCELV
jgi:hypothetical protein